MQGKWSQMFVLGGQGWGGVGHVGVGWGGSCRDRVGWVMHGWGNIICN